MRLKLERDYVMRVVAEGIMRVNNPLKMYFYVFCDDEHAGERE